MLKTLKGMLMRNFLLKLGSLIFATIVWLLVVNISNPLQSRNFTTSVEVINSEMLSEQGKYYTIPDGANTVTFRVTAPRTIIEGLSSEDFRAVADMNNLEQDSRIPIDVSAINHANSINISNRRYYLSVSIGEEMEEKFVIDVATVGEPASGFVVDYAVVDPNVISIRGPETIVSMVDSVRAVCDVTGMNEHLSENVIPILLDAEESKIDSTKLTVSLSTVNVSVEFTNVKTVPVELESSGDGEESVEVTDISFNPKQVKIKGDSAILNEITGIRIPKTVIDLDKISADMTTTVDISQYLPEGVTLTADTEPEVEVSIKVMNEDTRTLKMPTANISLRHLEEGKTCKFADKSVDVEVTALPSIIDNIKNDTLTGYIDLTGLSNGSHNVRVVMDDHRGVKFETVAVKIIISDD